MVLAELLAVVDTFLKDQGLVTLISCHHPHGLLSLYKLLLSCTIKGDVNIVLNLFVLTFEPNHSLGVLPSKSSHHYHHGPYLWITEGICTYTNFSWPTYVCMGITKLFIGDTLERLQNQKKPEETAL